MNFKNHQHLDEEQVLKAVVDAKDLPTALQAHLADCPRCLAQKVGLEQDLAKLGRMARSFAPAPRKRVVLPVEDKRLEFWGFLNWRTAFGAAITVATVLIVFWGATLMRSIDQETTPNLAREMAEAEQFMTEVNMLVENPLPQSYLDITGETLVDLDEDFIRFLIPPVEDDSQISAAEQKGSSLC